MEYKHFSFISTLYRQLSIDVFASSHRLVRLRLQLPLWGHRVRDHRHHHHWGDGSQVQTKVSNMNYVNFVKERERARNYRGISFQEVRWPCLKIRAVAWQRSELLCSDRWNGLYPKVVLASACLKCVAGQNIDFSIDRMSCVPKSLDRSGKTVSN
jgi:hypothetical protein